MNGVAEQGDRVAEIAAGNFRHDERESARHRANKHASPHLGAVIVVAVGMIMFAGVDVHAGYSTAIRP